MSIMPSEEVPQPLQMGIEIGAVWGRGTLGHTLSDSDVRPFTGFNKHSWQKCAPFTQTVRSTFRCIGLEQKCAEVVVVVMVVVVG